LLRGWFGESSKFAATPPRTAPQTNNISKQTDCLWGNKKIIALDNGYFNVL
jgi:hypothetical protein